MVFPVIREVKLSLSDFWFEYQLIRLSHQKNCEIDDELRARVYREFPVPTHLDFRIKIESFKTGVKKLKNIKLFGKELDISTNFD